jgi:hypothetical protein
MRITTSSKLMIVLAFFVAFLSVSSVAFAGPLEDAVDNPVQPDGSTPLLFVTAGAAFWSADTTTVYTSPASAKSGLIGASAVSAITTTVTGPATVSFYQKVDSEPTNDGLSFYLDNLTTAKYKITGNVNWQQKTYLLSTAGTHTLVWKYSKNANNISKGSDAAWIDKVVVSPNTAVMVTSPNGKENLFSGETMTITWNAPAAAEKYKLYYTTNGGSSWISLVTNTTSTNYPYYVPGPGFNDLTFTTTVPTPNGNMTNCKVKVVAYNNAGQQVGLDLSNSPFTITVLSTVAPNGGLPVNANANPSVPVDFTIYGQPNAASATLSFSIDNGVTYATPSTNSTIAVSGAGDYQFTWSVPAVTAAKKTKVKVVIKNAKGTVLGTATSPTFTVNPVFTISGTVTRNGVAVPNVTVQLDGAATLTTATDKSGKYGFPKLLPGNYSVMPMSLATPTSSGYTFAPGFSPVTVTNANKAVNFKATAQPASKGAVSGTISYPTLAGSPRTGRVYIYLNPSQPAGPSFTLAGSPGMTIAAADFNRAGTPYAIRGLQPGTYTINAYIDTIGDQTLANALNPYFIGQQGAVVVSSGTTTVDINLNDPPSVWGPQAPGGITSVSTGTGTAFIQWLPSIDCDPDTNNPCAGAGIENVESYTLYWGTSSPVYAGAPGLVGSMSGVKPHTGSVPGAIVQSLPTGTLYFNITSVASGVESAAGPTFGPVEIEQPISGQTITGQISFPGAATGPVCVTASGQSGVSGVNCFATPSAFPVDYSISGLSNDTYYITAFMDTNSNGQWDSGEAVADAQTVILTGGANGSQNLALSDQDAITTATSYHRIDADNSIHYGVLLSLSRSNKWLTDVIVASGPRMNLPIDVLGPFSITTQAGTTPSAVGDTYVFDAAYTDDSSEMILNSLTAVLNPPATMTVVSVPTLATPTFTWSVPSPVPVKTPYTYSISLEDDNDPLGASWTESNIPSSQTSILYNNNLTASALQLTAGHTYTWSVTVTDADGNSATRSRTFTR